MDPQQTKIFSAILLAAAILGIIICYFIVTVIRYQRLHWKLQRSNMLLEITTLENERRRIVSDLHDELGPLLSVVKFQISSLETSLPGDVELISKANDNLDTIVDRVRGICNHLMPQILTRKGFIMALKEFLLELDGSCGVNIAFHCDKNVIIPDGTDVHLYRMIQEMVNNTVKHASATNLSINITCAGGKLVITVADDGSGFNPESVRYESGGYGVRNILSRAAMLKADIYLASSPGKGTTYTIEIS